MLVIHDAEGLGRAARERGRASGLGGVLVPTMGALHEGHASLIRRGAALAAEEALGECVVSIFVNPTQFNDASDFQRYPRTLEGDVAACEAAGASVVFAPDERTMYPSGDPGAAPVPPLPEVATRPGLEDAHRPGHFAGVCQVVLRLFRLLEPAVAVFGEKDWQQLQVVRAMVRELGLPIRIESGPTVRDADGLALSSRNRFLSPDERRRAALIPEALERAVAVRDPDRAEALMRETLARGAMDVDYAVVRDAETLGPVAPGRPGRALIAARLGATRLIDNRAWPG